MMVLDGLDDVGVWIRRHVAEDAFMGRSGLFLDRDGVINVDTGYPSTPEEITLIESTADLIREANRRDIAVIVVSNQSGVGRGLMGWPDYVAVTDHIEGLLSVRGAQLDCILACAYHRDGQPPYAIGDHPMRKPNPGMLQRGAVLTGVDLRGSIIVGDRPTDMEAGRRAGLRAGWLMGDRIDSFRDPAYPVRELPTDPISILSSLD